MLSIKLSRTMQANANIFMALGISRDQAYTMREVKQAIPRRNGRPSTTTKATPTETK